MNNGRGIPQDIRDLIVSNYVPGATSLQDLSRVFGFAATTVKRILKSAGVEYLPCRTKKKVFGVGVNDFDLPHGKFFWPDYGYKDARNPFYTTWKSMLGRCYYLKYQVLQPTYVGCSVCDEWLTLSNFVLWMAGQDYSGKYLDKDILFPGNKVYSKDTCVFVGRKVNNFARFGLDVSHLGQKGVIYEKYPGRFYVRGITDVSGERGHLGVYPTRELAERAVTQNKRDFAMYLAEIEENPKVAEALRNLWN